MKILVVEDDHKIANSLKKGFEQENYIADVCYDGETGYDLSSTSDYDLIVLDLMLPKLDGIALTQELRKEGIHTPILMLTAKGELEDKIKGFEVGADDYLVKPFAFEELLARVRALARRSETVNSEQLTANNITIDTVLKEVKKDNKIVQLSKKEYQLLEYLMKNKGRVVSKEEIISRVWDYETSILPNTVEVFIKYLRNKVGKDIFKTVRGFGYKVS